jgi:hypothetical protein
MCRLSTYSKHHFAPQTALFSALTCLYPHGGAQAFAIARNMFAQMTRVVFARALGT